MKYIERLEKLGTSFFLEKYSSDIDKSVWRVWRWSPHPCGNNKMFIAGPFATWNEAEAVRAYAVKEFAKGMGGWREWKEEWERREQ